MKILLLMLFITGCPKKDVPKDDEIKTDGIIQPCKMGCALAGKGGDK